VTAVRISTNYGQNVDSYCRLFVETVEVVSRRKKIRI
jgi:hypothetical protein